MSLLPLTPQTQALFSLSLTLGAYLLGLKVRARWQNPFANPVLIAILIIGIILRLLHISYAAYFSGAQFIHFLLGPATVALAIPLVQSLAHIRRHLWPLVAALVCGSVVGIVSSYELARLFGGSQMVALSMVPKSATTPIAIGVANTIGGVASLSAVFAIAAGILVAITVNPILGKLGWDQPSVLGFTAGTAGSGIGASQVIPQQPLAAAFAGVAIGLNGIATAVLAPILIHVMKR